jgi:two-component system cell cycle response regulator DivK
MTGRKTLARVLLVEDYEDAREMYSEMLQLAGYEVVPAKDGQEALDLARKEHFDLVVLDVALPKVDGITVIRTLRGQPKTEYVPIITLSALVSRGMHKVILAAGANLALDKPCLPQDLEAAVRALLLSERGL